MGRHRGRGELSAASHPRPDRHWRGKHAVKDIIRSTDKTGIQSAD